MVLFLHLSPGVNRRVTPTRKSEGVRTLDREIQKRYDQAAGKISDLDYEAAIALLEGNIEGKNKHPASLSLIGVALARSGKGLRRAEKFCRAAICLEPKSALHYLRLAEVCLERKKRTGAIKALEAGLRVDPANKELVKMFNRLYGRREPVFPFLEREHLLNKYAGKLLANYRN